MDLLDAIDLRRSHPDSPLLYRSRDPNDYMSRQARQEIPIRRPDRCVWTQRAQSLQRQVQRQGNLDHLGQAFCHVCDRADCTLLFTPQWIQ
jgi:hypothetical protein